MRQSKDVKTRNGCLQGRGGSLDEKDQRFREPNSCSLFLLISHFPPVYNG